MKKPSKSKALERLHKALEAILDLKKIPYNDPGFERWQRNTEIAIENTFGDKSRHIKDFKDVNYSLLAFLDDTPESEFQRTYIDGLDRAESVLQSIIDEIEECWGDEIQVGQITSTKTGYKKDSKNIFIIHGHDDGAKETVARFITEIGLNPIILHEHPNQGRTIIEKFEDYADVAYAIAILSPDDRAAAKKGPSRFRDRARQNVIFELGYFIGKLGRKRACGIVKGDIEIPSDYSGVVYISLDSAGAWRMELVREFKAIDIVVDANLLF